MLSFLAIDPSLTIEIPMGIVLTVAVILVGVLVAVKFMGKGKNTAEVAEPVAAPVPAAVPAVASVAPGAAGKLKLHTVEPKTAAMLMAIVADKLRRPVNELRFISIKEV